uniref:BHLH domain-containing protein n=1 Tax=Glossina austeni TaxID=7395 RepID=A0A1A9UWP0_GLOAU
MASRQDQCKTVTYFKVTIMSSYEKEKLCQFKLGPCDLLPDQWATSSSSTSTITNNSANQTSVSTNASFLSPSPTAANNLPAVSITNKNCTAFRTTATATTICNLPRFSPAAATAAVSLNNAGNSATVVGLAPSTAGVVPLPNDKDGNSAGANVTANNNSNTVIDADSVATTTANNLLLARFSQKFCNTLPPHLIEYQHHQQLQRRTSSAAELAAALQRYSIMSAVASPISANSTTSTNRKIRKKTDSKTNLPQSQINKCNNEKRRRELENNYIEQLSEFLQLNKRSDMTSTKPDKAAILSQVVKTIKFHFPEKGYSSCFIINFTELVENNLNKLLNME